MLGEQAIPQIWIPNCWPRRVRSAVIHTISLAQTSLTHARRVAAIRIDSWHVRTTLTKA